MSRARLPISILLSHRVHQHGSSHLSRFTVPTRHHASNSQTRSKSTTSDRFTHLTTSGNAHMVSIPPPSPSVSSGDQKAPTDRIAIARAVIRFSNPKPLQLICSASLKKGDVLSVARIAGIMAAKRTSELVPLCHNIPLGGVSVDVDMLDGAATRTGAEPTEGLNHVSRRKEEQEQERHTETGDSEAFGLEKEDGGEHGAIVITARVHTHGQTGVEMEAMTAACVAGLTVYDMCKGVDRGMRMEAVRVLLKEGGRSGAWREGKAWHG